MVGDQACWTSKCEVDEIEEAYKSLQRREEETEASLEVHLDPFPAGQSPSER